MTAPRGYAGALGARLLSAGADLVWAPGVRTQRLGGEGAAGAALDAALAPLLLGGGGGAPPPYTAALFISRAGVEASLERLGRLADPARPGAAAAARPAAALLAAGGSALAASGLTCWALGADAAALASAGVPAGRIRTPPVPSTAGLVAALAAEGPYPPGAAFLAPVPAVGGGLTEPPVVPTFLAGLAGLAGCPAVVAPPAYETLPGLPPGSATALRADLAAGRLAAALFTSTAEAEGLAGALGRGGSLADGAAALARAVAGGLVLAAHGPTTAAGVEGMLGCAVSVVSGDASSFGGVVAALEEAWRERER